MIKWQLTTRSEFERLAKTDPETLTDLERAARFLFIQVTCFGGRVRNPSFGISPLERGAFDVTRLTPLLEAVHERLAGVVIECLPYAKFINTWDRPGTLFYLDPPYWGSEGDYGPGLWTRSDFARLAQQLRKIQGVFILSLNDCDAVRRCFEGFAMERVETNYTMGAKDAGQKRVGELLISNIEDLGPAAKGGAGTPLFGPGAE